MASPWEIIETTPEAAAALSWRRWLGPAFEAVAAVCLRETKRPLERIPCGCGCACNHRVRNRGTALAGVCDCGEECEDVPLTAADVTVWQFDLPRLGRAVAKALGCDAMVTPIGFHRMIQVAALGNPAVPIVLTVQPDAESCRNAVAHLCARFPKGFVLLTPTKIVDASTLELLSKADTGFFDLETHVEVLDNGRLRAAKSGAELFAVLLNERENQTDERRVMVRGRLKWLPGCDTVWLDDEPHDLRSRKKARTCLQFLVGREAFSEASALHLLDEIDPHVREQNGMPAAPHSVVKIQDYFKDGGQLRNLCKEIVKPVSGDGRYFLKVV